MEPVQLIKDLAEGKDVKIEDLRNFIHGIERGLAAKANIGFDTAFDRLIGHEGGYVFNKEDPGGETKFGISKRSYPLLDILNLTREQAREIYNKDFWLTLNAGRLPGSVAFQLFDFAVNSGISTTIHAFQRAIGVASDGHWGTVSQRAADALSENDLLLNINAERLEFMTNCKNWPNASKGWARRIASNLRYASGDNVF